MWSKPNQLYTVVRFQSGVAWNEHAVTSLLNIFAILLQQEEDSLVLAPVSRLMGLCATAGISVKELREMLALAGRPFPSSNEVPIREPGLDRLLLIRAHIYCRRRSISIELARRQGESVALFQFWAWQWFG